MRLDDQTFADLRGTMNGDGPSSADAVKRALFDDPLRLGDEERPREEVPGGCELAYRGQASVLFSERGHGKSSVATLVGVAAAVQGERVYYWDRENGRQLTGRRVASILDWHDWPDVRERDEGSGLFVYREYPRLDGHWRPEQMAAAFEGFGLVIYDSLREAIGQLGGNPDTEEAISKFVSLCVTPVLSNGGAVLIMDNVGHEFTDRPKGSASKLDAIPSAYKVTCVEQFSEVVRGRIEITCTRSRYGDTNRVWAMDVGAGAWELPRSREENPDHRAAREVANARELLRRTVVRALRETSPLGAKALVERAREAGLRKRSADVKTWIRDLVSEGVLKHSEEGYELAPERGDPGGDPEGGSGGGVPPVNRTKSITVQKRLETEDGLDGSVMVEKVAPPMASEMTDEELAELFPGATIEHVPATVALDPERWKPCAAGVALKPGKFNGGPLDGERRPVPEHGPAIVQAAGGVYAWTKGTKRTYSWVGAA